MKQTIFALVFGLLLPFFLPSCESLSKVDEKMKLLEGDYIMTSWINHDYSNSNLIGTIPNYVKNAEILKDREGWFFHFVLTGIDERSEYSYREINARILWNQVLCRYCFSFSDADFDIEDSNDIVQLRMENGGLSISYNNNDIKWERDL